MQENIEMGPVIKRLIGLSTFILRAKKNASQTLLQVPHKRLSAISLSLCEVFGLIFLSALLGRGKSKKLYSSKWIFPWVFSWYKSKLWLSVTTCSQVLRSHLEMALLENIGRRYTAL